VLLHLVAGSHNDALMMGLLVAGLALARERHPIAGIVVCALGALVKVPAIIGVLYIGWDWAGPKMEWRQRIRPVLAAGAICLGTMAVITELSGLGWGWATGLGNPDTVRSWMDPATAVGLAAGKLVAGIGFGDHTHVLLTVARLLGFLVAAAIGLRLLWRARGIGSLRAIGFTLLAVVLLGPVVQPWYLVWGIILLAPVAEGRTRAAIIVLSVVSSFLGLPGGRVLLHQLVVTNPFVIAVAATALGVVAGVFLLPRVHSLSQQRRAAAAVAAGGATGSLGDPLPAQSMRWRRATSRKRPNLRPTSFSTPTISKPQDL
ncbi:MAG: polyprenol phosphomannose-dependent alpha 1,6 mannosyltransferase MptB, partial [Acidimicrobiales bacterium]